MNILGIDTSTKKANVCLEYNGRIIDKSIGNEITHSEKLLPLINDVLTSANASLKEIDYLACSAGPGSFTGIRIGIATIKAFAKVTNTPIFNVSSLDILAYTHPSSDYVISLLDAKNTRIYYAVYKTNTKNSTPYLERISEFSNDTIDVALDKILSILSNENTEDCSISIIGDCTNNYKELFISKLDGKFKNISTFEESLSANVLNSMLKNYIELGIADRYKQDYLTLDAIYVRPSQAERAKNNEL